MTNFILILWKVKKYYTVTFIIGSSITGLNQCCKVNFEIEYDEFHKL